MAKNVKRRPKFSYLAKTSESRAKQNEGLRQRHKEKLKTGKKRITLHKASYRTLLKPL
jgi:hypothetical protein